MSGMIQLMAQDGVECPAYVAHPAGTAHGAVIVMQEIFGVNSHIRSVADGFAQQGYLAIAPHAFHRVRQNVELDYGSDDIAQGRELKAAVEALPEPGVMDDIAAAIVFGAGSTGGKVAIVGYCWGGLLVWRSACRLRGLSGAIAYYGGGMTGDLEARRHALCPVMCHFGEQDHAIPLEGVKAFAQAQPQVEVHIYAAQHGFNCDQRASYDAAAAQLAQERTLAFLRRHLS
ncbi:MAG: dienelactone hydrolase family protein [Betaproteobacteria bacterium]